MKNTRKKSGMIQGQGTGTSDDIEKDVAQGSYIMPADSTAKLGVGGLKKVAKPQAPVRANVSNGEFEMTPDDVHAVGVNTLNQMRDATHMPVPDEEQPEMFFANGGVVDDPLKNKPQDFRQPRQSGINTYNAANSAVGEANAASQVAARNATVQKAGLNMVPSSVTAPTTITDRAKNLVRSNANVKGLAKGNILTAGASALADNYMTENDEYHRRFGVGGASNAEIDQGGTVGGFARELGVRGLGYASDVANAATFGGLAKASEAITGNPWNDRSSLSPANRAASQQASQPAATQPVVSQAAAQSQPAMMTGAQAGRGVQRQAQSTTRPQLVSDTIYGQTQQPEQFKFRDSSGIGVQPQVQSEPQVATIGSPNRPRRTMEQQNERNDIIRAASTPLRGAQRGQLTANQLNTLARLQSEDESRDHALYNTDANNAAQAQREAASAAETMRRAQLQEQGQMARAQLQEQGQNTRFGAEMQRNLNRDALDSSVTQQELAMKQSDFADRAAERGFGIRKAQAEEALTNAYLDPNTSDSERARIGQELGVRRGQTGPQGKDRYMVVDGGETIIDNNVVKNQNRLIDLTDPNSVAMAQQPQQAAQPKLGANGKAPKEGDVLSDPSGKMVKFSNGQWVPIN